LIERDYSWHLPFLDYSTAIIQKGKRPSSLWFSSRQRFDKIHPKQHHHRLDHPRQCSVKYAHDGQEAAEKVRISTGQNPSRSGGCSGADKVDV